MCSQCDYHKILNISGLTATPNRLLVVWVCCLTISACSLRSPMSSPGQPAADNGSIFLDLYRGPLNHLAAVRQGQCPMHPSCSEYSRQCLQKHGPLVGWMMTFDRLMRCGRDELKTAPRIQVADQWKYYDPVEYNDDWWFEP